MSDTGAGFRLVGLYRNSAALRARAGKMQEIRKIAGQTSTSLCKGVFVEGSFWFAAIFVSVEPTFGGQK